MRIGGYTFKGMGGTVVPLKATAAEAKLFARIWDGPKGLTPTLARHVLKLGFSDADVARMRELLAKNREGRLTAAETEELDAYVSVGDMIAIVQTKARKLLNTTVAVRNGRG